MSYSAAVGILRSYSASPLPHLMSYRRWFIILWGWKSPEKMYIHHLYTQYVGGGQKNLIMPPAYVCQQIKRPLCWEPERCSTWVLRHWLLMQPAQQWSFFVGFGNKSFYRVHTIQNPFRQTLLTHNWWNIMVFNLHVHNIVSAPPPMTSSNILIGERNVGIQPRFSPCLPRTYNTI